MPLIVATILALCALGILADIHEQRVNRPSKLHRYRA